VDLGKWIPLDNKKHQPDANIGIVLTQTTLCDGEQIRHAKIACIQVYSGFCGKAIPSKRFQKCESLVISAYFLSYHTSRDQEIQKK
jgi:hypothetical protein